MADLQSSWHVEITSIGPGGYVFYYEDNVEPIKCWWDYSVTIAQIDLPAAASWDSTYPRAILRAGSNCVFQKANFRQNCLKRYNQKLGFCPRGV